MNLHQEMTFRFTLLRAAAFCLAAVGTVAKARTAGDNPSPTQRETLSLDQGWRFHLGDIPLTAFEGSQDLSFGPPDITHSGSKTGAAWAQRHPGSMTRAGGSSICRTTGWSSSHSIPRRTKPKGIRQRGIAWYRRQFKLDPSDRGKHLELQFDGVSTHCTVWFNGSPVHRNWSGYASFYIDITPMARYGNQPNTIAVRVDADDMEGWWYEGGGIYRHTWLVKRNPVHIVTDGVYANPVKGAMANGLFPLRSRWRTPGMTQPLSRWRSRWSIPPGKKWPLAVPWL